jgi:hypothetical protein
MRFGFYEEYSFVSKNMKSGPMTLFLCRADPNASLEVQIVITFSNLRIRDSIPAFAH